LETEKTEILNLHRNRRQTRGSIMKKGLTEKEQKEYLCSKIGESVVFKYPEPPYLLKGKLIDRIVVKDGGDEIVTYWNLIDLIRFEGEEEDWLRITYYRYKNKDRRWVFAGQTSLSDPISHFRDLFVSAIKEKEWIRALFKQVFKKCAKELD
jgi:hypothetical protein